MKFELATPRLRNLLIVRANPTANSDPNDTQPNNPNCKDAMTPTRSRGFGHARDDLSSPMHFACGVCSFGLVCDASLPLEPRIVR
jgi:hypothetical protein